MPKNLIQKTGSSLWYVKLIVPADVRKVLGRSQFKKSLQTTSVVEAERRKGAYLSAWWAIINAARAGTPLAEGWQASVVETMNAFGDVMQMRKRALIGEKVAPFAVTDELKTRMLANPSLHAALESLAKDKPAALGLETQLGTYTNTDALLRRLIPALVAESQNPPPEQIRELEQLVQSPSAYRSASPITAARLEAFRAYRVKQGIAAKTIDQQQSKLEKLSAYLREQGRPLNADLVAAWLESLPLSSKTKAQHLLAGSTFWLWAVKHDNRWREDFAGKDNPFRGQTLPKVRGKAKVEAARKAFTTEQIEQLYAVAKEEGNQTLCDLITLGAHTGCRIEELAQLRAESVVKVEGVLSFKIEDSKTAAGIREIPVHPALSVTVERLTADSTDGFLLPSSAGNKYGIRSDPLSKAFGRLKTAQGFGRQHVFHSVRSMVVTLLLRGGVPGPTVANIVGHETGLVTFDVYDEGASPRQKLEAIEKLRFKFAD